MFQQIIALLVIAFFVLKLFKEKKEKRIKKSEYYFWLLFWFLATLAILSIKKIDKTVADLGFSGAGIDVLFYIAVIILFHFIFKLRLKVEKMEKNITLIVRQGAMEKEKETKKKL